MIEAPHKYFHYAKTLLVILDHWCRREPWRVYYGSYVVTPGISYSVKLPIIVWLYPWTQPIRSAHPHCISLYHFSSVSQLRALLKEYIAVEDWQLHDTSPLSTCRAFSLLDLPSCHPHDSHQGRVLIHTEEGDSWLMHYYLKFDHWEGWPSSSLIPLMCSDSREHLPV